MEDSPFPRADRESILKHRRERNLQVLLPVSVVALLALIAAASVLAAYFAQDPLLAKWAAAASVVLLGIMIGFTLVLLIVLIAFNAGAGVALQKTPLYTGRFSEQFLHYAALARQYADKAVAPLIAVESWLHVPAKLMRRRNRKDA